MIFKKNGNGKVQETNYSEMKEISDYVNKVCEDGRWIYSKDLAKTKHIGKHTKNDLMMKGYQWFYVPKEIKIIDLFDGSDGYKTFSGENIKFSLVYAGNHFELAEFKGNDIKSVNKHLTHRQVSEISKKLGTRSPQGFRSC